MTQKLTTLFTGCNHTITIEDSLDVIAKAAGLNIENLKKQYDASPHRAKQMGMELAMQLKDRKVDEIVEGLEFRYNPGVKEFFENTSLERKVMISTGVDLVANRAAEELGFDAVKANTMIEENGIFTGKHKTIITLPKKLPVVVGYLSEKDIPFKGMVYVGNDETDVPIMRLVRNNGGLVGAYCPERCPSLMKLAHFSFSHFDELERQITYVNETALAKKEYLNIVRVFVPEENKVLLVKENTEPPYWNLPGGRVKVAENEEFIPAGVRETREETGVDVVVTGFIRQYYRDGERGDKISRVLLKAAPNGSLASYDLIPMHRQEILEAKLFDIDYILRADNPESLPAYVLEEIHDALTIKPIRLDYFGKEQNGNDK